MIYMLYSKLNANEVGYLRRILEAAYCPLYCLADLEEGIKDIQESDTVFVVHEDTKNKSVVQKRYELQYTHPYTRIDRPNVLGQDAEKVKMIIEQIKECFRGIKKKLINYEFMSKIDNEMLSEINESFNHNTLIEINGEGKSITIVPDDTINVKAPILTYSEFFMMYAARQVFRFDKIIISEYQ